MAPVGAARAGLLSGRAIPASAVLNYPHDEGSGSTLAETLDTYADQDGAINGATWTSDNNWWEGQFLDYDGGDDYTATGNWGSFFADNLTDHTIIVEAAIPSGDNAYAIGVVEDGTQLYGIGPRSFTGTAQGDWGIAYQDASANLVQVGTDLTFDDGNRHLFAIAGNATDASSINIYVDTGFVTTSTGASDSPVAESFNRDVFFGAANNQGSPNDFSAVDIGRVMVTDTALTETELDDIAERHGFSP